ncbi:hypothetical protein NQ315_003308 [Exocentrus adspersus]|uniref:Helitron helicase-like domain-containing protein n=1 Tax=Exocentrus adspersus TaxID=1586481 RepID=A0AAV8VA91_9CUCU|nr:hypothetical protein NQ315_003308 [Exocentrus adspersus]
MPQAKITVQAMVHRTADDTIVPRETPVLHTDVCPPPINHTNDVQRPSAASHLDDITALLATTPSLPQQVQGNARQDPARIREEVELDVDRRRNQGNNLPTYLMAHERVSRFGPSDLGSFTRMCNHCNTRYFTAEMTTLWEYTRCCHKDPEASVDQRVDNNQALERPLIARLEALFREINPYARAYMHLRERYNYELQTIERLRQEALANNQPPPVEMPTVTLELLSVRGANRRQYDMPVVEEVNIPEGHTAADHPSLTNRVFYAKVNQLTNDMEQAHVFGTPVANLHVIEFQKRGLPHCHDLLILKEEDRFTDSLRIDALISAEIPDRDTEPDLYEIVTSFMVHGPC